jgi:cytochrome b561
MAWKSSASRYGSVAITLHWVSAAAILAMFPLGFLAANTADPNIEATLLRVHVPLGVLVLVLTVARLAWWLFDRRPGQLLGMPRWQELVERLVRALLYVVLIVMGSSGIAVIALSGAAAVLFFGATAPLPNFWGYVPMTAHFLGAFFLLGLAGLHIAAALVHQFHKRDRLLARMGIGPA